MTPRLALSFSYAQRYIGLVVNLASVVILSRLLTPEEVGIYSVAIATVAIAHALRDAGVGTYVVQEPELTPGRFRAVFGIMLVTSWTIALAVFLARAPVAAFYEDARLAEVMAVQALNFVVIPFGAPVLMLLQREMEFRKLFVVQSASVVVGAAVSVGLAAAGHSYMSLAWGSLAGIVTTAAAAFAVRPAAAVLVPSFAEWRRVLSFAAYSSGVSILVTIGTQAPELIIGRVLGFHSAGIYSRANGALSMYYQNVMASAVAVLFPMIAQKFRNNEPVGELYVRVIAYATGLAWPFYSVMAILAFPVNRIMFGDQWDQAIPIMRILCVAGAIGALSPIHGHVLIATGRVRTLFRAECIIQPLFVSLYLMAASFGLQWIAGAAILGWICVVGLYLAILIPHLRLRTRDFVRAIAASLKLALCAAALPAAAVALVPERPDTVWILFFLGGAGAPAGFLAGLWATGHPLKDELLILARRVKLLGRPSGAA